MKAGLKVAPIKISIIVPYFNPPIERFQACIKSIAVQDYGNYELVLVDDGSRSEYESAVEELCGRYRIKATRLSEENAGVSAARNAGTRASTGDYVMYVDADDEVPPGMLSSAVRVLNSCGADVAVGYVQYISEDSDKTDDIYTSQDMVYYPSPQQLSAYHLSGSKNGITASLGCGSALKNGPVARLVKREVAASIRFPEGVPLSEDTLWNLMLFDKAKSAVVVKETWYWYWTSHESASRGFNANAYLDALSFRDAFERTINSLDKRPSEGAICSRLLGEINRAIRTYYAHPECPLSDTESMREIYRLTREMNLEDSLCLRGAMKGGFASVIKYLLCRSGFGLYYWKLKAAE